MNVMSTYTNLKNESSFPVRIAELTWPFFFVFLQQAPGFSIALGPAASSNLRGWAGEQSMASATLRRWALPGWFSGSRQLIKVSIWIFLQKLKQQKMYITIDGLCWMVPVTTKPWHFIHFHPCCPTGFVKVPKYTKYGYPLNFICKITPE